MRKGFYLFLVLCFSALNAVSYDGLWFIGFNLDSQVWQSVGARENRLALACATNRQAIAVASAETPAAAMIYPVEGLFTPPDKDHYSYSLNKARHYFSVLPKLRLLHSDGPRTKEIVAKLQQYWQDLGVDVEAREVPMDRNWGVELKSKDYDVFLMGFKADYKADVVTYLSPLFGTGGYANFMGYSNSAADSLINQMVSTGASAEKLAALNSILYQDLPIIPLFYIEEL